MYGVNLIYVILDIAVFFGIPALLTAYFIVSLVRYLKAKKAVKNNAGTFSDEQIRSRKKNLIVSSVLFGLMIASVITMIILLSISIAYM